MLVRAGRLPLVLFLMLIEVVVVRVLVLLGVADGCDLVIAVLQFSVSELVASDAEVRILIILRLSPIGLIVVLPAQVLGCLTESQLRVDELAVLLHGTVLEGVAVVY